VGTVKRKTSSWGISVGGAGQRNKAKENNSYQAQTTNSTAQCTSGA